jgi:hypothetical protein
MSENILPGNIWTIYTTHSRTVLIKSVPGSMRSDGGATRGNSEQ